MNQVNYASKMAVVIKAYREKIVVLISCSRWCNCKICWAGQWSLLCRRRMRVTLSRWPIWTLICSLLSLPLFHSKKCVPLEQAKKVKGGKKDKTPGAAMKVPAAAATATGQKRYEIYMCECVYRRMNELLSGRQPTNLNERFLLRSSLRLPLSTFFWRNRNSPYFSIACHPICLLGKHQSQGNGK